MTYFRYSALYKCAYYYYYYEELEGLNSPNTCLDKQKDNLEDLEWLGVEAAVAQRRGRWRDYRPETRRRTPAAGW